MNTRSSRLLKVIIPLLLGLLLAYQTIALAGAGDLNTGPNPTPDPGTNIPIKQPQDVLSPESHVQLPSMPQDDGLYHYPVTLTAGSSVTFTFSYTVPEVVFNRGDIMFIFDRTGSMGGEINTAKAAAIQIMTDIRTELPFAWFGVASFMDYPGYFSYPGYAAYYGSATSGDLPWIPGIDPTTNITAAANAINALTLGFGEDWPEDYTRALYELRFSKWRADSKKIAVLFGDAPTHDLDFAGYNFGGDPGRNGVASDGDDLDFEAVVAQLAADDISVIAVDSGYSPESEATFKGMSIGFANAPGTQGLYYNLSDTSQLPASVVELIRTETSIIDNLTISYIPEYTSWVQTTPPDYQNVEPNTTVDFVIRVTVPEGTTPGFYPFLGTVLGDGAILQLLYFEITVPGSNADLDLDYRPQRDGYSFENFDKKSASYVPLSWAMFQQFFGADQVLHPNGDPIGMAERYYTEHYRDIGDGGHCDGFSSTSMFNYQDLEQTNAGPFELPKHTPLYSVKLGDPGVRDAISFAQGLQRSVETMYYGATMCQVLGGSPNAFFRYTKSLFENNQPAVIAITWYDDGLKKNVSHSLLPYRLVEDQGHNRAYIYVYDSNDPTEWYDSEHRIVINTQADTWEYDVQTLWFIGIKTVSGDSDPCHFTVKPLEPYLHKGVPPWNVVTGAQVLDSNVSEPVYRLFTEYGPARLLFVDDIGQRFGWYNGAFYEEIPSAYYQPTSGGIEDLSGSYLLPEGIDYSLYLFSAGAGEAGIGYWHNNKLLELSNLQLITDTLTAVSISPDEDIITLNAITGTIQTSLVADHLASGEDVYLQIFNLNVEQNGIVNMAFTSPPFELGGGEQITLTTSSPISQIVGLALVRRGGEGYSAFSNASVDLDPSSTAAISVLDWDNIDTITMSVDLDQNGTPDISRTVNNTSQPASVELEASRLIIYPHETVDLTAAVRDQLGIHVNNGSPVIFTTNLGALSTAQGETSAGLVNVSLNPGSQFGTATVTAQVPDTELSATIQIVVLPRTLYLPLLKR